MKSQFIGQIPWYINFRDPYGFLKFVDFYLIWEFYGGRNEEK